MFPQLAGDIEGRQASRFASGGEIDVVLAFAQTHGVLDFVEGGMFPIRGLELGDRAVQHGVVRMRQFILHVRPRPERLSRVRQSLGAGDLARV